jgi:hypothetical protein
MGVSCETANAGLPTEEMGQSRLHRADGRFGHVGFPPIASGFSGAATFRNVPRRDISSLVQYSESLSFADRV